MATSTRQTHSKRMNKLMLLTLGALTFTGCVDEPFFPDGGTDAGTTVVNDAGVALACPVPTLGPTTHRTDVTRDTTWTAATSPHIVETDVDILDGATLRIEPCVEVRFAKDTHLRVAYPAIPNSGALIAEGTEQKPITFKGEGGVRWSSLFIYAPGTARLAYVTIENGGADRFEGNASINVVAGDVGAPMLFVDHVTVRGSLGTGVRFEGAGTFIAGSQALTITGSGNGENPYPLAISEHAFDALPTGSYTGNRTDEIVIDPVGTRVAGSGVVRDATVHERGVPYHVGRSSLDNLLIGGGGAGTLATLTFEPGVVMKFEPGAALHVQRFSDLQPSTAAIRALGTAEKPVVFTSAATTPRSGDWRGLWFGGVPRANNVLDHVRIEYAGAWCGCQLLTCSDITSFNGAVIFNAQPPSAFITNTTFANIEGHGITQGFDGTLVNFRPGNTFENVSGCAQTRPRDTVASCPSPRPVCD